MSRPVKHYGRWRIRWVGADGERHSLTFDDFNDAKRALAQAQNEVEQVRAGLRMPVVANKTFAELCDYWITNKVPTKRSGADDISIIKCHLRPAFGTLRLCELNVERADRFIASRVGSVKTVHNQVTLLISMLNKAVDLNWLERVPRIKKPKVRLFDKDFRYLRTEDEIQRLLRAARDEGEMTYILYSTAIYTGMREGELAGLRWDDVNFDHRLITVQRSYAGPTKAGDVRHVPILDALLSTLRDWRLRHPGKYVFTNQGGRPFLPSARIFQETLQRVLRAAGFQDIEINGKLEHYIVFHSLRHTFASHWVMRGGDLFKLQKILGHKTVQMTMRYAHLQPGVFVEDYDRLGAAPGSPTDNLLTLPGVAATRV